jgi:hypothetical protein
MLELTEWEETIFVDLILDSVAERYVGKLNRREDEGVVLYTPDDIESLETLFDELWGERLLPDEISEMQSLLIEVGCRRRTWRRAWCDDSVRDTLDVARARGFTNMHHLMRLGHS